MADYARESALRADHLTNSCCSLLGLSGWRAVILWQIVLETSAFDDVDISRIDRHSFGNILPSKIVIVLCHMLQCPLIMSEGGHRIDLDRLVEIGPSAVGGSGFAMKPAAGDISPNVIGIILDRLGVI